jgi:hypothetical protein
MARRASGAARSEAGARAREESDQFLRTHPGASLSARVRSACRDVY